MDFIYIYIYLCQMVCPAGIDISTWSATSSVPEHHIRRYTGHIPFNLFTLNNQQDCTQACHWLMENFVQQQSKCRVCLSNTWPSCASERLSVWKCILRCLPLKLIQDQWKTSELFLWFTKAPLHLHGLLQQLPGCNDELITRSKIFHLSDAGWPPSSIYGMILISGGL